MLSSSTAQPTSATSESVQALRERLFAAIDKIAPILEASAAEAEKNCAPTAAAVNAMREAGLLRVRAPKVLGGEEVTLNLFHEVIERVAYYDFSSAWILVIYADNTAFAATNLNETGLKRLMPDGEFPIVCGGGGLMMGELTPAEGGYRVSGRWIYGSGIPQSDYTLALAMLPPKEGEPPQPRTLIMKTSDLEIVDNWHVMGLSGTGSADFIAKDVFVPEEMTYPMEQPTLRGGPIFKLGLIGFLSLATPPMMLGAARRVLDDMAKLASTKSRGYSKKIPLARRGVFQAFLGEADIKLKAARQLALAAGADLQRNIEATGITNPSAEAEARAIGTYCSRIAVDVVTDVLSYAGGTGVQAGHRFERTLRDLTTGATHNILSNISYENHSEFLMELPDAELTL